MDRASYVLTQRHFRNKLHTHTRRGGVVVEGKTKKKVEPTQKHILLYWTNNKSTLSIYRIYSVELGL